MLVVKYKSWEKNEIFCVLNNKSLADLGGGVRDAPPRDPNSFIFMQFSVKK